MLVRPRDDNKGVYVDGSKNTEENMEDAFLLVFIDTGTYSSITLKNLKGSRVVMNNDVVLEKSLKLVNCEDTYVSVNFQAKGEDAKVVVEGGDNIMILNTNQNKVEKSEGMKEEKISHSYTSHFIESSTNKASNRETSPATEKVDTEPLKPGTEPAKPNES